MLPHHTALNTSITHTMPCCYPFITSATHTMPHHNPLNTSVTMFHFTSFILSFVTTVHCPWSSGERHVAHFLCRRITSEMHGTQ